MKQEIKPATGRLGVLVVGVGGAVATTMIVGTLASRKGLAKPIGSITQLATMRMENNEEKLIKDVVPLTDLNDIVFGGWDIFPDNAYEAAMYAEVLKEKDLNGVKDELEAIKPMPAAFDHNWAKPSERYAHQESCYPLGNGRATASGHPRLQGCQQL